MIQRNRTTKHEAQDRLLALIATLGNPIPQREMAKRVGRTDVWLRRNVKEMIAAGRMRILGTLRGPGGGTVYAVGPGPSSESETAPSEVA